MDRLCEGENPKDVLRQLAQWPDLEFTTAKGVPMRVRMLPGKGGDFRPSEPIVQFYDRRYVSDQWPHGQPISQYYASTLVEETHGRGQGLCLMGHEPGWDVDATNMQRVRAWIRVNYPIVDDVIDLNHKDWDNAIGRLGRHREG